MRLITICIEKIVETHCYASYICNAIISDIGKIIANE